MRAIAQAILQGRTYQRMLLKRIAEGTLPPAVECMIWYYAYGKPKERIEHSGEIIFGLAEKIRKARERSISILGGATEP